LSGSPSGAHAPGSAASSVFGEPRQTLDADLVARLIEEHVSPLAAALSEEFYLDRWARELELADLLARAWSDAGLPTTET